jgi:hypothetical protein
LKHFCVVARIAGHYNPGRIDVQFPLKEVHNVTFAHQIGKDIDVLPITGKNPYSFLAHQPLTKGFQRLLSPIPKEAGLKVRLSVRKLLTINPLSFSKLINHLKIPLRGDLGSILVAYGVVRITVIEELATNRAADIVRAW